jgi:hypothetical protein
MTFEIDDRYAACCLQLRGEVRDLLPGRRDFIPRVRVTVVEPEMAHALQEYFGCGRVSSYQPHDRPSLTFYVWEARYAEAVDAIRRMFPYLVGKKRRYAKILLRKADARTTEAA